MILPRLRPLCVQVCECVQCVQHVCVCVYSVCACVSMCLCMWDCVQCVCACVYRCMCAYSVCVPVCICAWCVCVYSVCVCVCVHASRLCGTLHQCQGQTPAICSLRSVQRDTYSKFSFQKFPGVMKSSVAGNQEQGSSCRSRGSQLWKSCSDVTPTPVGFACEMVELS